MTLFRNLALAGIFAATGSVAVVAQEAADQDRSLEQLREEAVVGQDLGDGCVTNPERRARTGSAQRLHQRPVATHGVERG